MFIKEFTDPKAPPRVAVKPPKIGPIKLLILPIIFSSSDPRICSAAHNGALSNLPTKVFRKLPIVSFKPPIKFSKRQYMVPITPLTPSANCVLRSSGINLLVKLLTFSSTLENMVSLIPFTLALITPPIFLVIRSISASKSNCKPVMAS